VSSSEPNQCETIGRARVRRLQKFVTCAVEVENWGLGVNCLHYLKTLRGGLAVEVENWGLGVNCLHYLKTLCGGLAVEHGILFRLKVEEMTVVFFFCTDRNVRGRSALQQLRFAIQRYLSQCVNLSNRVRLLSPAPLNSAYLHSLFKFN
jgi:hypothetical protein